MRHLLLSAFALALASTPATAQGWIDIERPRVAIRTPAAVVRVGSEVRTVIEGRVARVEVEERFQNQGGAIAEGSYLYPLPGEAVFQNFSLWMGDQELKGEMLNADQARGIYEEIVRRQKDPALLTLAGHGLVRAQVFPIQPGETRKVVLRYTQLLDRAGDALRVRYALGTRGGEAGSWQLSAADQDAYGAPYSPTHPLTVRRDGGRLELRVDPRTGGDIEILLPLRRGLIGTSVLAHAPGGEDGYAMLLLSPAESEAGSVVPRDLAFVVDVSGSMSGTKLEQAKAAIRQALGTLHRGDRFRLVAFSSGITHFRDGWAPATPDVLREAAAFVDRLNADGGTNIAGALEAVLGTAVPEGRLPLVLFMTDGIPSVGESQPDRIAAMAASRIGRARVFTVGVGHDVNTYLLDRLAREGRGTAEYVPPEGDVEVAMGNLMGKLRRPALVNLRLVESPVTFRDLSPAQLPDLFYGEELVLFGRYRGQGSGVVVFEGERNGRRERFTAQAVFPATEDRNGFIARLWAARRIGDLNRQLRLEGSSEALIGEIRQLGLRHGILTEYTSYLVQEPGVVAQRQDGQGPLGAGNALPATAPSAQTGLRAFEAAKASGELSRATTLAAADQAADARLEVLSGSSRDVRRAGGRVFNLVQGVWTDVGHSDSLRVLSIAPYSAAYFAVTRALPELAGSLGVGDELVIAGRKASLRIGGGGKATLSEAEVRAFVRDFRG